MKYSDYKTAVENDATVLQRRWFYSHPATPQYGFGFRFTQEDNDEFIESILFLRTVDGSNLIASSNCTVLESVNDIPWDVLQSACILKARLKLWREGAGHSLYFVVYDLNGASIQEFSYDPATNTYETGLEPLVQE